MFFISKIQENCFFFIFPKNKFLKTENKNCYQTYHKPSKGGVLQLLESKSTATKILICVFFFFHMSVSNSMFSKSLV